MIAPETIPQKSREAAVRPTFRIEPPAENSFVAASPVSLTPRENKLEFGLAGASSQLDALEGSQILADMVSRCRRETEVRPLSGRAHANLGFALLAESRFNEAENEFQVALTLEPDHYVAAVNLARVKVAKAEYADAEQLYQELLRTYSNDPALLMSLAYLAMRRNDFGEAAMLLKRVTSLDQDAVLPRYHLAIALLAGGKLREAIHHLRVALRSDVRSAALYHALGVRTLRVRYSLRDRPCSSYDPDLPHHQAIYSPVTDTNPIELSPPASAANASGFIQTTLSKVTRRSRIFQFLLRSHAGSLPIES